MNRTRIIFSVLFIGFLPFSFSFGQEKKNERKIKVIVADKEGTKIVIDTAFVYADTADLFISNGDSMICVTVHDKDNIGKSGKRCKIITRVDKSGDHAESKYIYVNDDNEAGNIGDDKFDISVSTDDFDNDTDKTRYIIAKNGIKVSIEGNDEIKIKELVKEIDKILEIDKGDAASKPATKETDTKIIRKK
jgi:cellulose synthase/poly-beta-1,6-N-acetylglucosamine synthase-like glycosyltransferase